MFIFVLGLVIRIRLCSIEYFKNLGYEKFSVRFPMSRILSTYFNINIVDIQFEYEM